MYVKLIVHCMSYWTHSSRSETSVLILLQAKVFQSQGFIASQLTCNGWLARCIVHRPSCAYLAARPSDCMDFILVLYVVHGGGFNTAMSLIQTAIGCMQLL